MTKINLSSIGYSEGGAYAIWTAKYLSKIPKYLDKIYTYTTAIGYERAYNLKDVVIPFLTEYVGLNWHNNQYSIQYQALTNLGKPGFTNLALQSYLYYTKNYRDVNKIKAAFNASFFDMACSKNLSQSLCGIDNRTYNLWSVQNVLTYFGYKYNFGNRLQCLR